MVPRCDVTYFEADFYMKQAQHTPLQLLMYKNDLIIGVDTWEACIPPTITGRGRGLILEPESKS